MFNDEAQQRQEANQPAQEGNESPAESPAANEDQA